MWTRYRLGDDNAGIRRHNSDSPVGATSRAALVENLVYTSLHVDVPLGLDHEGDRPKYVPARHAEGQLGGAPWSAGQNQVRWPDEPASPPWWVGSLMALRHQQPQGAYGTQQSPREEAQLEPHLGA